MHTTPRSSSRLLLALLFAVAVAAGGCSDDSAGADDAARTDGGERDGSSDGGAATDGAGDGHTDTALPAADTLPDGIDPDATRCAKNDRCCGATAISLTNGRVVVRSSTAQLRDEHAKLACQGSGASSNTDFLDGPQAYYKLTAKKGQWYRLGLSPAFDAYLYAFTSGCADTQIETDCQSHGKTGESSTKIAAGSRDAIYFKPQSSRPLYIAIDSTLFAGPFELTVEETTAPTNGKCSGATALALSGGKSSVEGDTSPLLTPDEFSTVTCKSSTRTFDGPQAYYTFDATASTTYRLSLEARAASSLYMYVFGDTCTPATINANCGSDGASGLVTSESASGGHPAQTAYFTPTTSGTYAIGIDSASPTDYGRFGLTVEAVKPAKNTTCSAAQTLTLSAGRASARGFSINAKDEFSGQIDCGDAKPYAAGQLYYKVALQKGTQYSVGLSADFDAKLYLFRGSAGCQATAIDGDCTAGGTRGAKISITANTRRETQFTPATTGTFYIAVDGESSSDAGLFSLHIRAFEPPTLTPPFTLDFESNDGNLAATRDWQWGKLSWKGGSCGAPPPNDQGHVASQNGMWATVLDDCYTNLDNAQTSASCTSSKPADDSILAFKVAMPSGWTSATLSYEEYADLFTPFDFAEVRVDNTPVKSTQVCASSSNPPKWQSRTVDLSSYAGKTVTVAFHMLASDKVNRAGWYIDQIAVKGQ